MPITRSATRMALAAMAVQDLTPVTESMAGPKIIVDPETFEAAKILLTLTRDPNSQQYKWKNDHRKATGNAVQ